MIGQTISHYRIVEKLGEGGMGVVYKAEDMKLKRPVALKFLRSDAIENDEHRERFQREAQAAAALDHPNICTVYEIDEADGQAFLAMAYLEGQTVKDKVKERPLKLDEAIDIAIQTAQGLQAAHAKGIVHRDIKSANLMVTPQGHVKIMDFGLAQLAERSELTKTAMILGTPAYMSPEQARREPTDRRTDVWSLGVVIYEMVTGRLPFEGERQEAVLYAIGSEEPEPITALRAGLPMELDRIVGKALAKAADERYQHVEEMMVDLRAVAQKLKSGKSAVASAGAGQAVADAGAASEEPKRQSRLVYAGLAVALLALIATLGYFGTQNSYEPTTTSKEDAISTERPSIAVLPLENVGGGEENEYFSEGVTDDIISQLSKIGGLKVISRTSSGQYKNTDKGLRQIADELGVSSVLEGSVRRSGDRVRIMAQLVDAGTDETLWSATYDRDLSDIFGIQSEVARTIAGALEAELTPGEIARLEQRGTTNLEAYQLVLAGRSQIGKLTPENWKNALDSFKRAVELDPNYAYAYYGLALCYERLGQDEKSKQAAMRALELNDQLAESHVALARVRGREWDWAAAEQAFDRSLELDPNSADAHGWYAAHLYTTGRTKEAVVEARKALELDPLSLLYNAGLGWSLIMDRQWDAAIAQWRHTIDLDPGFGEAWGALSNAYMGKGMYDAAIEALKTSDAVGGSNIGRGQTPALGYVYARAGNVQAARDVLDQLRKADQMGPGSRAMGLAIIHAGLGEKDQAFEWLNRAADERFLYLPAYHRAPVFDTLRSDPRFKQVQKRMGLED